MRAVLVSSMSVTVALLCCSSHVFGDETVPGLEIKPDCSATLKNSGTVPIYLYGYPNPKAGGGSPFYSFEVKQGEAWAKRGLGWCGTGAGPIAVAPGSSVDFKFHHPDASKDIECRVMVNYRTAPNGKEYKQAISNAVMLAAKAK